MEQRVAGFEVGEHEGAVSDIAEAELDVEIAQPLAGLAIERAYRASELQQATDLADSDVSVRTGHDDGHVSSGRAGRCPGWGARPRGARRPAA